MEGGLRRNDVVRELSRSSHGDLKAYIKVGAEAARQDPNFFAHLIAWNDKHGQIRDSKVALPIIALRGDRPPFPPYFENALAHMALLDPRNLVRAVKFSKEIGTQGAGHSIRRLVERYLRAREKNWAWWERTALQHRESIKTLYSMFHVKPHAMAQVILRGCDAKGGPTVHPPAGTAFDVVRRMKDMGAVEAAGLIAKHRIPFLVVMGTVGDRIKKDDDLALALIERMTPTELVTNTKLLEKAGVRSRPALRSAFEEALEKAASSKKSTFKTTRAAQAVGEGVLKEKLLGLQERQIDAMGGVDGDWLVLGDRSGSMAAAIEGARMIAGTLARVVKGKVHLVFFDTEPEYIDATGKTYEEITKLTRHIAPRGGTSIGVGLAYILERHLEVGGIAVVSDGGENSVPYFSTEYKKYADKMGVEPTVYLYLLATHERDQPQQWPGYPRGLGIDVQTFDLRKEKLDYYSLPNLVQTMRTSRFSLADEILGTPLLTLADVFKDAAVEATA